FPTGEPTHRENESSRGPRFPIGESTYRENESRRGPRFPTGEATYRENKNFTFERPESQPFRPPQEFRRGQASNNGANFNKPRGGQVQNRRKPVRKMRSDDQNEHDKPLRESLMNQLESNRYECAICCQIIHARQGIWSCKTCYHMFHISGGCIINWAKKSKEDDNKWRCPTCQTKYETIPYNYFCFCGKQRNPTVTMGEIPHSCGNVCGGQRAPGCPHRCNEPCHPGPCPECPVMLTRRCNCGNIQKAVRCGTIAEVKNGVLENCSATRSVIDCLPVVITAVKEFATKVIVSHAKW
ncbi:NF-X1 type zinc finger, partial [Cooperia oncophora]